MTRDDETAETVRRTFLRATGVAALLGGAGGALAQDGTETETPETGTGTEPGTETGTETTGEETPTEGIGGLVSVMGGESVEATVQSLEGAIEESRAELYTTINHTQNASRADMPLPPMRLLIFGNPSTGASLMQASPTAGIDLPQKILVWEGEGDQVWITFNDPRYIAARHGIRGQSETLQRMRDTLNEITGANLGP